jgi:outer membrane immunogenic protein
MFQKSLYSVSAAVLTMGAGAANAADMTPLPRDWSGFYAGIHVGLATGLDASMKASSQYETRLENGENGNETGVYCRKETGANAGDIAFFPNRTDCPPGVAWSGPVTPDVEDDIIGSIFDEMARASSDDDLNFLAGINAGYNWQHGAMVFGVEADISAMMDGEQDISVVSGDSNCGGDLDCVASMTTSAEGEFGLSHFGTLRARLGYDIDGTWLPFITGGLAWGKVSTKGTVNYDVEEYSGAMLLSDRIGGGMGSVTRGFGDDDYELGWTVGAGINYRVADNAFIGLTYLYTDLGEHSFRDSYEDLDTGLIGSVEGEVDARFHSVRLSFDVMF